MKLKYEFVLGDPNINFPHIPFQDGGKEKPVEMCSLDVVPLQNASGNVEMTIISDTLHIQRRSERKNGSNDVARRFSSVILPRSRNTCVPGTHERVLGIPQHLDDLETNEIADVVGVIAEDFHLTRCAQAWFTGKEDDQAEQHDHGTIDEVPGDPYMERGGDSPEEADREVNLLEQVPLLGQPESRPCTFNHEVGNDVFEIIDLVDNLRCRLCGSCIHSSLG